MYYGKLKKDREKIRTIMKNHEKLWKNLTTASLGSNFTGSYKKECIWKEIEGKPYKINELILKGKADLKDLISYNSHPWIMFSFNLLVIIWRGGFVWDWTSKVKGRGGRGNVGRRWTRRVGGLENWTIFMDVLCVSPLIYAWIVHRCIVYCEKHNSWIKQKEIL